MGDMLGGGGGISSSSSADGDNTFGSNRFDYRNGSESGNNLMIPLCLLSFVVGIVVTKAVS